MISRFREFQERVAVKGGAPSGSGGRPHEGSNGSIVKSAKCAKGAAAAQPFASPPGRQKAAAEEDLEMGKGASKKYGDAPDVPIGENSLEAFFRQMDGVQGALTRIAQLTREIEGLHRQALVAASMEEAASLSRRIEELSQHTSHEADAVRQTLLAIDAENRAHTTGTASAPNQLTASDLRIRRSRQASLVRAFAETMRRLEGMHTTYREKYREQLERQYRIVRPDATREELERLTRAIVEPPQQGFSASGAAAGWGAGDARHAGSAAASAAETGPQSASMLSQQIFSMANRAHANKTLLEMSEKRNDILLIEKSMAEVHQIFADIALLVDRQGETLDSIAVDVQDTLQFAESGEQQMKEAVVKKRNAQRRRWLFSFILIILILGIGAAILVPTLIKHAAF